MQRNFAAALSAVLAHEGGYVNHRADPGGPTNLGVTLATAKRLGIDVDGDGDTDIIDIKLLKPDDAAKVYKAEYWDKVRGDELPDGVDYAVFDFAVNSGVSRAAKYLQTSLGVNSDGRIGPLTLKAATTVPRSRLIKDLCDRRIRFLQGLGTFKTFGKGWTARVEGVRKLAAALAAQAPETVLPIDLPDEHETPASEPRKGVPGWLIIAGLGLVALVALAIFTPIF
jgi:lysozyme family protein